MANPAPSKTRIAGVAGAGAGIAALLPWAWNFYIAGQGLGPEMPPEVAGPLATAVVSPVVRYVVKWLPNPG